MRLSGNVPLYLIVCTGLVVSSTSAAEWGLKKGTPELQSAGVLAFGPDGILFVGDARSATIFAIQTQDMAGSPATVHLNINNLGVQVAELLSASPEEIRVNDLAVNPLTGNAFLSVVHKKENSDSVVVVKIDDEGVLTRLSLEDIDFSQVVLPNSPEDKLVQRGRRKRNPRLDSITDIAFTDGKLLVSGLVSGDSASNVREIAFPFAEVNSGTSVEIYHGAHGRVEDYAAIRTFVPFNLGGEPQLLAAYVCTPLVRFPLKELNAQESFRGTTIAELGNRNRPLDMIVYEKAGKEFLLLANDRRGVMKISTEDVAHNAGITERVGGGDTAGQSYETIEELQDVVQLDKLNDTHALVMVQSPGSGASLLTITLP